MVDEFSELLKAKPEIVQSFVRIGAVGRSLGIHLLIASQRLEQGKLRGLDEHLSYRIGLKTFSATESRAVLGITDAYDLPSLPGIGYLKSPDGTITRFRASYVSGVPKGLDGETTTFQYAVEQMRGKGNPAHVVWLPPLVTPNSLDDFMPDLTVTKEYGLISPSGAMPERLSYHARWKTSHASRGETSWPSILPVREAMWQWWAAR